MLDRRCLPSLALVVLALMTSCGKDPVETNTPAPPVNLVWTAQTSGTTETLFGVVPRTNNDIFAFGQGGTVRRFNGTAWSAANMPTTNARPRHGWTSPSGKLYVTDENSGLIHVHDGTQWSSMDTGAILLISIWGFSDNDIMAVGYTENFLRYNGSTWGAMQSESVQFAPDMWGMWGASPTNVYAAGGAGTIMHFDGTIWSSMMTGTTEELLGIWGLGPDDIYAVGNNGVILHYDGTSWNFETSNTTINLFGVWGAGRKVYVCGEAAVLERTNGAWMPMEINTTENLRGIRGTSTQNVFVVGTNGTIFRLAPE